ACAATPGTSAPCCSATGGRRRPCACRTRRPWHRCCWPSSSPYTERSRRPRQIAPVRPRERDDGEIRSSDGPRPPLPVRLAQLALQDLAVRIARQLGDELHRPRRLVVGQALAAPRLHGCIVERGAATRLDDGVQTLAPPRAG